MATRRPAVRELEVMRLLCEHKTLDQVAVLMKIQRKSAEILLWKFMRRHGLKSRLAAIRFAKENER